MIFNEQTYYSWQSNLLPFCLAYWKPNLGFIQGYTKHTHNVMYFQSSTPLQTLAVYVLQMIFAENVLSVRMYVFSSHSCSAKNIDLILIQDAHHLGSGSVVSQRMHVWVYIHNPCTGLFPMLVSDSLQIEIGFQARSCVDDAIYIMMCAQARDKTTVLILSGTRILSKTCLEILHIENSDADSSCQEWQALALS